MDEFAHRRGTAILEFLIIYGMTVAVCGLLAFICKTNDRPYFLLFLFTVPLAPSLTLVGANHHHERYSKIH